MFFEDFSTTLAQTMMQAGASLQTFVTCLTFKLFIVSWTNIFHHHHSSIVLICIFSYFLLLTTVSNQVRKKHHGAALLSLITHTITTMILYNTIDIVILYTSIDNCQLLYHLEARHWCRQPVWCRLEPVFLHLTLIVIVASPKFSSPA